MKQLFKLSLLPSIAVIILFFFTGCSKDSAVASTGTMYTLTGNAGSGQVVPTINAMATGTLRGTYDASTGVMTYTSTWNGLSGSPTVAGFYNGASGTSGAAVIPLWNISTGLAMTGSFSASRTLNADQSAQLKSGSWYYALSTPNYAGGEIRGQITATPGP